MDANGLNEPGRRLWDALTDESTPEARLALILEASRTVDRLDELDNVIHGKGVLDLMRFRVLDRAIDDRVQTIHVRVEFSQVLAEARQQGAALKALLAEIAKQTDDAPTPGPAAPSDLDV